MIEKKENFSKFYNDFSKHFLYVPIKQVNKKSLEENLVWSYCIDHLDLTKINSDNIKLLIVLDYYVGLNPEDREIYSIFNDDQDQLIHYCAEKVLDNPFNKKKEVNSSVNYPNLESIFLLFDIYLDLFQNKNLISLLQETTSKDDLKALIFMDEVLLKTKDFDVSRIIKNEN